MTDKRRDVLDGIGGYVPGPWYATRHPYWPNAMVRVSTRPGDSWSNFGQICYATPAEAELIARAPELVEEIRELRVALEHMVCNCIACEGLGELREAVQAWDVPGAPVPECGVCRDARALLPTTGDNDES